MIKKLFGETDEEQFQYLEKRFLALAIAIGAVGVGFILQMLSLELSALFYGLALVIFVVDMFSFGWAMMRGLFGIASVGVLFSRNVVLTVIILMAYLAVGLYGGAVVAVIGLCRYFVLLKQRNAFRQRQD